MGIGLLELVIIAVAALVLLGPEQLPSVLKQLGRLYVPLRRTSNEVRSVFDDMVREAEKEMRLEELQKIRALAEEQIIKAQQMALNPEQKDAAENTPHLSTATENLSLRPQGDHVSWDHGAVAPAVAEQPVDPTTNNDKI